MTTGDAQGQAPGGSALLDAVHGVLANELQYMVLDASQLPAELAGFELLREADLDNATMAKHGFGEKTADDLAKLGRITGYVREFVVPQGAATLEEEPAEIIMAATVIHLFENEDAVKRWIDESFVRDFRNNVGKDTHEGQTLQGVEILQVDGFHDYAASLLVIHEMPDTILASTIIDFRMGNLLGVAYVVAKRDVTLSSLAKELAVALEQQMVRVALGAA
jgi:hypothetical protein